MNYENFMPFEDFVRTLRKRRAKDFINSIIDRRATNENAEIIRAYLQKYYRGAKSLYSFIDEDNQVWDCMPIDLQPALRGKKKSLLGKIPTFPGPAMNINSTINVTANAPPGTVPVRRLTLNELVRYNSLNHYFQRVTNNNRRYAYSHQQVVNHGAGGFFNVWQPKVRNNDQFFSLSQVWVVAGKGKFMQTVEAGWHVLPQKYKHSKPVFFIYWTPDFYTTGSFNNDKDNTFVLAESRWKPGASLSPVSTIGGQQYEMRINWYFYHDVWWLYINGQPVGYYLKSIFKGGALSRGSDAYFIGGEVSSNASWPEMGSGLFANEGHKRSCYIRNIHWFDQSNLPKNAILNLVQKSPGCYTIEMGNIPGWGTQCFFGGPGGNNCIES